MFSALIFVLLEQLLFLAAVYFAVWLANVEKLSRRQKSLRIISLIIVKVYQLCSTTYYNYSVFYLFAVIFNLFIIILLL